MSKRNTIIPSFFLLLLSYVACAQNKDTTWIISSSGCKIHNPHPVKNESITWEGECFNGYASGYGKLVWFKNGKSNQVYNGFMKRGIPNGMGRYDFSDGTIYEGHFKSGDFHGIGHYTERNKEGQISYSYIGEFVADGKSGFGKEVLFYSNRADTMEIYEGHFKNDIREGEGRLLTYMVKKIFKEYYGTFVNDVAEGKGKFLFALNGIRPSEYIKNTTDSAYTQDYCDEMYIGDVISGEMSGKGTYFYRNGVYEGDWKKNERQGYGVLFFNQKLLYEGDWQADEFNGFGKGYKKGALNYAGYWKNNLRSGFGAWRYSHNGVYIGEFKKHLYNGFGYIMIDGSIAASGKWLKGELIEKISVEEVTRKLKTMYPDYDRVRKIIVDD